MTIASSSCILFYLIIPPPPSSTLFPYTTLFRSLPARRRHPMGRRRGVFSRHGQPDRRRVSVRHRPRWRRHRLADAQDRKSTRLNSSHVEISYAVFCLKKKKMTTPSLLPSSAEHR